MKKIVCRFLCLVLALSMLLGLTACGEKAPAQETGALQTAQTDEAASDGTKQLVRGTGDLAQAVAQGAMDANPNRAIKRAAEPIRQSVGCMLDGTPLGADFYLYRETLSEQYKQAYDVIRAGLLKAEPSIEMTVPVSMDDIFNIYLMVIYDSPEFFWVETTLTYYYNYENYVTSIEPVYNDLAADIPGNTAIVEAAAARALADMWSLESDLARAKYAHDYLTQFNDYISGCRHNQDLYSSLVNGETVCAGYARAFMYLMEKMGIRCAYIVGDAGGSHAWNLVELDGKFYNMDVTWDDPIGATPREYYYDYFNITDEQISSDHTRDELSILLPQATDTSKSFWNAYGAYEDYGTDFGAIQGVLPKTADNGSTGGGEAAALIEGNSYLS